MKTSREPIALEAYEKLAHVYADLAESKPHNGYNEHPAIRAKIGEVEGLSVFDAGCGPGFLLRDLLAGGAGRVVGMDVSPSMTKIARERVNNRAEVLLGDLAKPIQLPDASFDLIVSSLAIDYVFDWSSLFAEFHRLLSHEGRLVFSVQHPMGSYAWYRPSSAFGIHYCEASWKGFTPEPVVVPDYYRSFAEIINPLLRAHFRLCELVETQPVEALKHIDPNRFQQGMRFPSFLVIDATRA